jgi:hypothetical protein
VLRHQAWSCVVRVAHPKPDWADHASIAALAPLLPRHLRPPAPPVPARPPHRRLLPGEDQAAAPPRRPRQRIRAGRAGAQIGTGGRVLEPARPAAPLITRAARSADNHQADGTQNRGEDALQSERHDHRADPRSAALLITARLKYHLWSADVGGQVGQQTTKLALLSFCPGRRATHFAGSACGLPLKSAHRGTYRTGSK